MSFSLFSLADSHFILIFVPLNKRNHMKLRRILLLTLSLTALSYSQVCAQSALDRIHVGLKGTWHGTTTHYSNLGANIPDPQMLSNGNFGIFAEFETSESGFFSIRPELMFLQRGTKIEDIPFSALSQADYLLKAKYTDIRVPLILNFGKRTGVRPYIFIAPVLGIVRGGTIEMSGLVTAQGESILRSMNVGKSNMASAYFAGDVGAGIKFPIKVGSSAMHLGIDLTYEHGFTDTYSPQEKNGDVCCGCALMPGYNISDVSGTRKFSSFEVGAHLSVPLSIFKGGKKKKEPRPVVKREEAVKPAPAAKKSKSCYSLEEILALIDKGENVRGKTLCAIDQINFDTGKSTIKASSRTYLNKLATLIINTGMKVEVKGHTDSTGSDEVNMKLSKERAEAVYNYLIQRGVEKKKLSYSYYGESRPIESNDTDYGRRMNRRVEFEFK